MAKPKRSWLDGPQIPADFDDPDAPGRWPGEKLGLPKEGAGSLVSVMRRIGGVCIDWFFSWIIAIVLSNFTSALGDVATTTLIIFVILGWLSGWFFARTPGHAILGMGIARVDATAHVGWWRALVRSVLTILILPAVMVDSDGRGLHDKATGTAVIRG
ncbi:RDD family protein [Corynebacterium callunae]|uniref:RDD family protein n=1 Tax=Corynebacterium callunae TaxID=1721 RepID=UPI0039821E82